MGVGLEVMGRKRVDTNVRLDAEVARLAKAVAAYRDKTLVEYITEVVRKDAEKEWKSIMTEQEKAKRPKRN